MNSPIIWIFLPGVSSIILLIIRRWNNFMNYLGFALAILLSWLAWTIQIGQTYSIGSITFKLEESFAILGRKFVLNPQDTSSLVLIYAGVAFWFGAARVARTQPNFIPAGMGVASLLTAAIAVEPFLYAALLIEISILVFVLIMLEPGKEIGRGALRFLTLQTLGLPFILFAGWLLTGSEVGPIEVNRVIQASVMLGFGFALLLAIFPFHTWIPMIAEESHPYVVAFVFYLLPIVVTLFGLGFLDQYSWFRNQPNVRLIIQYAGVIMIITGGVWILFQLHLGRIIGFAMICESGVVLLLVSTNLAHPGNSPLLEILFIQLLPRGLSLGLWALSSVALCSSPNNWYEALRFRNLVGLARNYPIASTGVVLSLLSLSGFPLLAGFPARLALWNGLASESIALGLIVIFGCSCILFIGLRTLAVLVMGNDEGDWKFNEQWRVNIFLIIGICVLILFGVMPQLYTPMMAEMTEVFINLSQ